MPTPELSPRLLDRAGLGAVNCPMCNNTGYLLKHRPDGSLYGTECECMPRRRSLRRIQKSGLAPLLARYTFDSFETPDGQRRDLKERARAFCAASEGWFYLAGQSGSGKTHLCTAMCGELIKQGRDVLYIVWKDFSVSAKARVNDAAAYAEAVGLLKRVPVLYLDDFLKVKDNDADLVTPGDINLAFEIINARYLDPKKRTIISAEFTAADILGLDEALGGRIYERARGYYLAAPGENWRLKA